MAWQEEVSRPERWRDGEWQYHLYKALTKNVTRPVRQPDDDERIRRIVRQEIAELPIQFDVPDAPPDEES